MLSSQLLPPLELITPSNRGPILSIIAFTFLSCTVIIVLAKLCSSLYFKNLIFAVDIPIWISLAIAFIRSLLTQFAIDHGLGRHTSSLSTAEFNRYNQLTYAAHLLLFLVLSLPKVSTALLIYRITPGQYIRRATLLTLIAVGAWTVFALLGIAFQCRPPRWKYLPSRCAGEGAITYPIMIVNILTDLALVMIPLIMIWNVQMAWHTSLRVSAAFGSRIVVVVVNIAELVVLPTYLRSTDPTWTVLNVDICNELMMYLSIIAACMPTLYRVLNSLASGLNNVHVSGNIELSTSQRTTPAASKTRNRSGFNNSHGENRPSLMPSFLSKNPSSTPGSTIQSGMFTVPDRVSRRNRDGAESTESTESTKRLTEDQPQTGE